MRSAQHIDEDRPNLLRGPWKEPGVGRERNFTVGVTTKRICAAVALIMGAALAGNSWGNHIEQERQVRAAKEYAERIQDEQRQVELFETLREIRMRAKRLELQLSRIEQALHQKSSQKTP